MKLFRWKDREGVKPGLIIEDIWYDATAFEEDYKSIVIITFNC
jgi:hypothetical protein